MEKFLTQDLVKSLLEEMGLKYHIDSDGDLCTIFGADSDFHHDVVIYFIIKEDALGIHGFAKDYLVDDSRLLDALLAVNKFNVNHLFPKAALKDDLIIVEQWFVFDRPVPTDYLKDCCLRVIISCIWNFFVELRF